MFLSIDLKEANVTGYINLGEDLSKAQDLLTMVQNNIVWVKDDYHGFKTITPKSTVEVVKEIKLEKEAYSSNQERVDVITIRAESDDVGIVEHNAICRREVEEIQANFASKYEKLRKENEALCKQVSYLESVVDELKEESVEG